MKQTVEVEIAGQKLVIRSDEGPAYVQALADFVDEQIRELMGPGRANFNLQRISLLAAIRIADRLFREKDLHQRFRQRVEAKLDGLEEALCDHESMIAELAEETAAAHATETDD